MVITAQPINSHAAHRQLRTCAADCEKHVRGVKDARHDEAGQEPQGVVKIHLEKPLCVFLCGVCV